MKEGPAWTESKRCPACGGLNAGGASWCSQCLTPFKEPVAAPAPQAPAPPAPPPAPPPPGPPPGTALGHQPQAQAFPDAGPASGATLDQGVFRISDQGAQWRCGSCGSINPMASDFCGSCGIPFRNSLSSEGPFGLGRFAAATSPAGIFDRISRGFRLIGASASVLASDAELVVLPLVALLATVAVGFGLFELVGGVSPHGLRNSTNLAVLGLFYYAASFIAIYCNAALVAAAGARLKGENPSLVAGLRAASGRLGPIAAWAAVSATVNIALRVAESANRRRFLRRSLIQVAGVAWSAVTFFVVPVIVFEPLGAIDALRRSSAIFRSRWSETLTGNVGIGMAIALFAVPLALLTVAGLQSGHLPLAAAGVILIVAVALAGATLSGIFSAALYQYATTAVAPAPFNEGDFHSAFD